MTVKLHLKAVYRQKKTFLEGEQCVILIAATETEGMRMKILVLGGSYFLGRVFVMQAAAEHEITVVNRGSYSMAEFGVKELRGDRSSEDFLKECREDYDVLVDFNAYQPGDIQKVLRNLERSPKQYIFISTADVYRRGTGDVKTEDTPFETRMFPGEAGNYIAGKVALEGELRKECTGRGIAYTVLRPVLIYGPYNYAPRESLFIQIMVQNHILPEITDASGRFQMVYVKDAAEAVLKCLLNEKAFGQAYNISGDEILDYHTFAEGLGWAAETEAKGTTVEEAVSDAAHSVSVKTVPFTVEAFTSQGLELPFPVTEAESELYSNEKSRRELGMVYTEFTEGIRRTYRAFRSVF